MKAKFFLKFCLAFLFFTEVALADENNHGKDHAQTFHAFTLEGDIGEARDGSSKGFDFSGWVGGDYNRMWLKSEKKNYGNYEEKFEAQALYSRNFSQFWDAQIGVSHDFSTDFTSQNVNYFTIGLEGLAPQFFETEAQIFLSDQGRGFLIIPSKQSVLVIFLKPFSRNLSVRHREKCSDIKFVW